MKRQPSMFVLVTLTVSWLCVPPPASTRDASTSAGFVDDGVHPNTVLQALWANAILTALNLGYRAQLVPLSEQEMLTAAGIAYGGNDTLLQEIGPLGAFVRVFVFVDGFESGTTSGWSQGVP